MTIKTKLITNVLLTVAIIGAISLTSYFSMRFLQERISYLTEKSSPFQMRTVEFQRELQGCITNLIKINAARTMTEYTIFHVEAERSLANVKTAQEVLEKMNGGTSRLTVSAEMRPIADELFTAVLVRINSDRAANEAIAKVSQQMKDSSAHLRSLDTRIRNLQVTRSAAFSRALENTSRLTARLRELEELRNHAKDLITASGAVHNARNTKAFLITQGKMRTILGRIARNTSGDFISFDRKELMDDSNEFLHLQADAISNKDDASTNWALESFGELSELLNSMIISFNQDIELASSKLTIETHRQGIIFAQSNSANNVLVANSELVALGLTVTGELNRLFMLDSISEVDTVAAEIRSSFVTIQERARFVESSLARLDAKDELAMLQVAIASLTAIRSELYSTGGIIATLKQKLDAVAQANTAADKLHARVNKQLAQGNKSVSVAQGEQEKSIAAVNRMVSRSLSRIAGISGVAIIIGIFFGFWIYRSILQPLRVVLASVNSQQKQGKEQARLAEAVAAGDLSREVLISSPLILESDQIEHNEMGTVLSAVVGMSKAQVTLDRAFAGMTASLRRSRSEDARRDRLKSGLFELNKILRGDHATPVLGDESLFFLAGFLGAGVGIMYLYNDRDKMLQILSTYAISRSGCQNDRFLLGEGLPGQVALERKMICLQSISPDYLPIASALGSADPLHIVILPIMYNEILVGVLELGSFRQFDEDDFDFLTQSLEGIAIALSVTRSHQLVNELLEQSQAQAEELRVQQEELLQTSKELGGRARTLTEGNPLIRKN